MEWGIAWNRAIEEMTGIHAKDMLGKGNYEYAASLLWRAPADHAHLILKPQQKIRESLLHDPEEGKGPPIIET